MPLVLNNRSTWITLLLSEAFFSKSVFPLGSVLSLKRSPLQGSLLTLDSKSDFFLRFFPYIEFALLYAIDIFFFKRKRFTCFYSSLCVHSYVYVCVGVWKPEEGTGPWFGVTGSCR